MQLVSEAALALDRIRVLNLTHVLLGTPAGMRGIEAARRVQIERLRQLRATLTNVTDPDLHPSIDAFFASAQSFIDLSDRTIELSASGGKDGASRWARATVTPAYTAAEGLLAAIRNEIGRHNRDSLADIQRTNRNLTAVLVLGVALLLSLVALTFLLGLKRVLTPLERLTQAARRVSAGDYDVELDAGGRDEAGVMAAGFNDMIHSQKKRMNELHGLLEVSEIVSSSLDLPTVLRRVLLSGYLLGAEEGAVLLAAPDGAEVRVTTSDSLRLCEMVLSSCVAPAVEDMRPQMMNIGEGHGCEECLAGLGFRHALAIPMHMRDQRAGCLLFLTRQASFQPHEVRLATILGNQAAVAIDNARLHSSLWNNYRSMIAALAQAVNAKSAHTGRHSEHLVNYGEMVGIRLGLPPADVELVREGCLLHDIGKIGIRDRVLNKSGPLTSKELAEARRHPLIGAGIIAPPDSTDRLAWQTELGAVQDPAQFLKRLALVVRHHHERFDGKGYPDGLKGEEIPLAARIISVVDAFEAMTTGRPYRKALPFRNAIQELRRCAGTQFDPEVVETFIAAVMEYGWEDSGAGGRLDEAAANTERRPPPAPRHA